MILELPELIIQRCGAEQYDEFERWHYCASRPGLVCEAFLLRGIDGEKAGIITFSYPPANCAGRNVVFARLLKRFPQAGGQRLRAVNAHFRIVSRIVILPEYRGLGIGRKFLIKTVQFCRAGCVEALSASGRLGNLFVSAGFKRFRPAESGKKIRLKGLLAQNRIPLGPASKAERQKKLDKISSAERQKIQRAAVNLLKSYGSLPKRAEGQILEKATEKLELKPEYCFFIKNPKLMQEVEK
ncbi:GNAT family N-acetyltransferase [Sedimentisphaera salicampi]|uniref:N-acetyltransferase domain-containing protein n=1 Tax=Sedimentisphaera salicampi TaxID=1941349 RepID=A0A1W6LN07_9BACT|nr:GNAT family N-acetyltransferase [Sedimentisphaera salicampi]ARN57159.1 hypothetical protein STSP1_01555 [Sedimentisphaera salicampi]OXU14755.1 hypothetical protein SMSP1_01492 [Sedimentisphaera salicampi]